MIESFLVALTKLFKKSLKKRISGMIFAFVFVVNLCYGFLNYNNFVEVNDEFSYSTASTVAKTCVLIIDSDRITNYINTLNRDTPYYETWNKMIDYRNTNDAIVNLSLVNFSEDGCVYIFDTDLTENGAFLGDQRAYKINQIKYKEQLINGKEIGYISYANRMDVYVPVLSSYNIPVGYVIVGISTSIFEQEQQLYFIKTMILLFVLTLITLFIFMHIISRKVVGPINSLSVAAANYKDSIDKKTNTSALDRLEIRTGDEIEVLYSSLKKMEKDILDSSNNLGIALWNSYHDSMTQLYNKRHFNDALDKYNKMNSIGIIYFDIDKLKTMNDTYGHEDGDDVIMNTATFLNKYVESDCESYRVGGDEFLMVVCNCTKERLARMVLCMKSDNDSILTDYTKTVQCRIAIGSAFASGKFDTEIIVKEADKNMYINKQSHRNNYKS